MRRNWLGKNFTESKYFIHNNGRYKFIKPESGVFNLTVTSQIVGKWQSAIDKQIPTYLNNTCNSQIVVKLCTDTYKNFILNLPTIPKNIEEIKIIRCWIKKIGLCYFNNIDFVNSIFNPELIQFIFDKEEIDKIKFNCKSFCYSNITDENVLLFYLNRLAIGKLFWIKFFPICNEFKQKSINILFKFLLKFPKIFIDKYRHSALCKIILNYIETTKDYSNMINYIKFNCSWLKFNLSERAEFIKKEQVNFGLIQGLFSYYQLTNQHNPKVKFSIDYVERNELISHFKIERISG